MARIVPLGATTVAAAAIAPLVPTATAALYPDGVNALIINALPGNAGPTYILNASAAPNTTTYSNILAVLASSGSYNVFSGTGQVNEINLSQFYVSSPTAGYGVYSTAKVT